MNVKTRTEINETRDKIYLVEKENGIKLSKIQKILLSVKQPVTGILDVLYGSVRIFALQQKFEKADEATAELLDIDIGDEILYRETIIHNSSGQPLFYALSYIPTSRCNEEVIKDLQEEKITTGTIMSKYNFETLRRTKDIYIEEASDLIQDLFKTNEKMVSREYIIIQHGKIRMWTKESFPITYFKD